jgi:L-cysteine/cystine lyase
MIDISSVESLARHRQQFPALANKTYFNYGGQGPLPQPAWEAIRQAYDYVQQEGPFSKQALSWIFQEVAQTRCAIAQELGVAPETITLTEAVSVGCNIALWGMDWQAGDHLLLSDCEHPGIVAVAQQIRRRYGIEISTCPLMATLNHGDPAAIVAQHLRPNTRLLVISHVLWNTGQVLPLESIVAACRHHSRQSRPVAVLVDAAQSVGVLPLNLSELDVDFYAFTGHKWWCGPDGVGGLYIHPKALEHLQPTFVGWRGIITDDSGQPLDWQPDGRRFEIATSAFPLCAGLKAAISLHQQWGSVQERHQRILQLSQKLWEQLMRIPAVQCLRSAPPEAGLISFQIENQAHQQLVQQLEAQRIMVRLIVDPNCVRACVHYFTLESELDKLVETIHEFC